MTRGREIVSTLVVLVLGLLMLVQVSSRLKIWSGNIPGPGFFPALVAGAIVLLSGAIVLAAIFRAPDGGDAPPASRSGIIKVAAYIALMIALALLFERLGFVISSLAFLATLLLLVERQPLLRTTGVAVGAVVIAYALFVLLLKVPLPAIGIGPF